MRSSPGNKVRCSGSVCDYAASHSMQAVPIQMRATIQIAARTDTGTTRRQQWLREVAPRQQGGVHTPEPVARVLGRRAGHRPLCTAEAAPVHRSARLEWADTAPSRRSRTRSNRPPSASALCRSGALIEKLTGVRWHRLRFRGGAVRTRDGRLKKHRSALDHQLLGADG